MKPRLLFISPGHAMAIPEIPFLNDEIILSKVIQKLSRDDGVGTLDWLLILKSLSTNPNLIKVPPISIAKITPLHLLFYD